MNKTRRESCVDIKRIEVQTAPGFDGWGEHLRVAAYRQFAVTAETKRSTALRVKLASVERAMSNFTQSGQLSGTSIRLRVTVDLVEGTRMLWTSESQPITGIVQHTGTPRITTMNVNDTMQTQITDGMRILGRAYRQYCLRSDDKGETP